MEENIRSLKIIIGEHNIAHDTVNTLFGLYRNEAENVSTDSIFSLIRNTERNFTYDPSMGNLISVISTGQLGYISNSD